MALEVELIAIAVALLGVEYNSAVYVYNKVNYRLPRYLSRPAK